MDTYFQEIEETKEKFKHSLLMTLQNDRQAIEQDKRETKLKLKKMQAKLIYYARIQSRRTIVLNSEVGWINKNKIIVTLNNDCFLLTLNPKSLHET